MTEGERLTEKLWEDQPYNTSLSVIREILFALLKDKAEIEKLNVPGEK